MSIKCKIGDVVRVYRHIHKGSIGLIGVVTNPNFFGQVAVKIVGMTGSNLYPKTYLAHVKKETTVIVGVHKDDAFYDEHNNLIGKQCSVTMEDEPNEEGYFTGELNITNRGDLYFYAIKLLTYNKGKK